LFWEVTLDIPPLKMTADGRPLTAERIFILGGVR
jgi:hypothetical protein